MRVLFLACHPVEGPSTRYRTLQYFPFLERHGISCELWPFMTSAFYNRFYFDGPLSRRAPAFGWFALRRLAQLARMRPFDVAVVHREAMLFGPPLVEWAIARIWRKPIVFDFDDAIFLYSDVPGHGVWAQRLKMPWKTDVLVRSSDHVVACNQYLYEYAITRNRRTVVIPTVVDAERFSPACRRSSSDVPVIGWVGSPSTRRYVEMLIPVFEELASRHRFRLKIVGGGRDVNVPGVDVANVPWSLEREVSHFADLDIGIYPLSDTPWARGKTGFKAVQCMAMGIPTVCSSVGGVVEFVKDGENGFLAETTGEWIDKLSALLEDAELRRSLGARGRQTVEEWYCVQKQAPRLKAVLESVVAERGR